MNGEIVSPLCENSNTALDPVFHIRKLFASNIDNDRPAFSFSVSGNLKCTTYDIFTLRLKQLLTLAGYSPELFRGHSLRRGGATLLFQLNCNPLLIQALWDWTTDQYLKYCGLSLEQRYEAQLLMCSST